MKNILVLWIAFGLIWHSCTNSVPEPEMGEQEEKTTIDKPFTLSEEQIEMAGIEMGKPEKRLISDHIDVTGYIEVPPQNLISVYAPVTGFARKVNFLAGDYVRQGQILVTITHPELIRLQGEFLESARKKDYLAQEYQRKVTLNEAEATSLRIYEEAKADYEIEKVHYKGLAAELTYIGIDVSALETSGKIQDYIHIRTPAPGYITKIHVNKGKLVQPEDLLYQIVDNRHIHLELQVFAKDLSRVKKGQKIKAYLPGSEVLYPASVYLVGRMIDLKSKTSQIHGHFDNENIDLVPGTYLQAQILSDEREVWVLPQEAIVREGSDTYVFLRTNGSCERIPVILGHANGDWIEIQDLGLQPDQMIITKGAYYVHGYMMHEE